MRLKDFPTVTPEQIAEDDMLVLDGSEGTRNVNAKTFLESAGNGSEFELPFDLRKLIWREKNLGKTFTVEQRNAIKNGTFEDLYLGDYWVTNHGKVTIVDFDYWKRYNSVSKPHHLVVMPTFVESSSDYYVPWSENSNENGYKTCKAREVLNDDSISGFKSKFVTPLFGNHLMSYGASLSSEKIISSDGKNITNILFEVENNCKLELLNERMIFGSGIFGMTSQQVDESDLANCSESDTQQLLAFNLYFNKITEGIYPGWLRDISGVNSASVFNYYFNNCFRGNISSDFSCFLAAFAVTGD